MDEKWNDTLAGPLVAEATKKSDLVWLTVGEDRPRPVWHVWLDGAAYVVSGGSEQPVPGLESAPTVTVTVRSKDKGGRLVSWTAGVAVLAPHSDEWEKAVKELASKRLNAHDSDSQPERWARDCVVCRLSPIGDLVERPGAMPHGSHAVPPPATPATTLGRLPYVLGRGRAEPPRA